MRLCGLLAVLGMLAIPIGAAAQGDEYTVMPYATGLNHPRGLTWDPNGNLVVATEGTGNGDGAIWRLSDRNGNGWIDNESEVKPVAVNLPSWAFPEGEGEILGPSGVTYGADGTLYAVTGGGDDPYSTQSFALWSSSAPNNSTNQLRTINPYAHFGQYEWAQNPDGAQLDSDPYSVVVDADGNAYVNDAAANDTLKVAPDGTITTYAVYPPVEVPAELGLPFPVTDAVPTGLAVGPDGALYVSLLTGFPFSEGASMVYRLEDLDGDGNAMGAGEMTVYADGLTTSTALAFDADGNLLATEFRGPLTDPTGQAIATGDVVEWVNGAWQTVADGLVTPTGLTVGPDGTIYVSMEFADTIIAIHEGGE
jgi:sugar lactone lactonase YvrE